MSVNQFYKSALEGDPTAKMPVVFIGHGDPMNVLRDNAFTQSLNALGKDLLPEKPKAVLCISAHWLTRGTFINNAATQPTIHDFGGFPPEMYEIQYPAKGHPQIAVEAAELVEKSELTTEWGLDHGAWTVLKHVFPDADVPVFQMSIDYYKPMDYHFSLAAQLKKLRERGVLIVGSGNVVHNLQMSIPRMMEGNDQPFDWAIEFDNQVKNSIANCHWKELATYDNSSAGKLSVPTPDHYAPLMYTLGVADESDPLSVLYESVEYGGLSMRTFRLG